MSKPSKQLKLVIDGGRIKAIYDDALTALFSEGDVETKRASHVEPYKAYSGGVKAYWSADLRPVGGPILMAFETRQEALDAEVEWLKTFVID